MQLIYIYNSDGGYILPYTVSVHSSTTDRLHQPPHLPHPAHHTGRGQPYTLPRYLTLRIDMYMQAFILDVHICMCTYVFHILATYNTIQSTYLLPIHCLYTTDTYLYNTVTLPMYYMHTTRYHLCTTCLDALVILLYSPYSICNPLHTPTHTTAGVGIP